MSDNIDQNTEPQSDNSDTKINQEDLGFVDKVKIKSNQAWNTTKEKTRQTIEWIRTKTRESIDWTKRNTIALGKWLDKNNAIQLLIALTVSVLGVFLSTRVFDTTDDRFFWLYVLLGVGVIAGIALWIFVAQRYLGKILFYIVEHKWVRKVFAGGSFSYFEYQNKEDYTLVNRFTEPIGLMITSFIAFLGLATTSIGIIRIIAPDVEITSPILWGVLAIITPILGTLVLPIAWTLTDLRVKGWNEKNQTTWMVSKKFKRRLNSFITIGAVVSNIRSNVDGSGIGEQIEILIGILRIGAVVVFMSVGFFIIFYFVWYRAYLRKLAITNLDLNCYEVILEEHDFKDSHVYQQLDIEEELEQEEQGEESEQEFEVEKAYNTSEDPTKSSEAASNEELKVSSEGENSENNTEPSKETNE